MVLGAFDELPLELLEPLELLLPPSDPLKSPLSDDSGCALDAEVTVIG